MADVAAIACALLDVPPSEVSEVLDLEAVSEILAVAAGDGLSPAEEAAGLLHGFLEQRPMRSQNRALALLVAVHFLKTLGLDIDLEPDEETRKHLQDVANGAEGLEARFPGWLPGSGLV